MGKVAVPEGSTYGKTANDPSQNQTILGALASLNSLTYGQKSYAGGEEMCRNLVASNGSTMTNSTRILAVLVNLACRCYFKS
jgi:hypothetical protein